MPQVRVLSLRPHENNPNILLLGESFGLFVLFEHPNFNGKIASYKKSLSTTHQILTGDHHGRPLFILRPLFSGLSPLYKTMHLHKIRKWTHQNNNRHTQMLQKLFAIQFIL